MFDLTVQVVHIGVGEEENNLELQMVVAATLPGPEGQPSILPLGMIRTKLGRDACISTGQELLEKGEALPEQAKKSVILPDGDTVATVNRQKAASGS